MNSVSVLKNRFACAVFLSALVLSSFTGQSQVYKFRAFQSYFRPSDQTRPTSEDDWNKVDILVVLNFDKNKVTTFGNKEGDYDFISQNETYRNSNNDKVLSYQTIDGEGEKCTIEITIFNDQSGIHVATLSCIYPFGSINFRLKKIE
jgi:hypothetical protein